MQEKNITVSQMRAARAALVLTLAQVAKATGIGIATLKRYEATTGVPASKKNNLQKIKSFYEAAGIEFIGTPDDRPGIRINTK